MKRLRHAAVSRLSKVKAAFGEVTMSPGLRGGDNRSSALLGIGSRRTRLGTHQIRARYGSSEFEQPKVPTTECKVGRQVVQAKHSLSTNARYAVLRCCIIRVVLQVTFHCAFVPVRRVLFCLHEHAYKSPKKCCTLIQS